VKHFARCAQDKTFGACGLNVHHCSEDTVHTGFTVQCSNEAKQVSSQEEFLKKPWGKDAVF
jgi:hypothetical protein